MERTNRPVDIIIPVYSGNAETLACVGSVCDSLQFNKAKVEVVVIFDAGPDLELRDQLLKLASHRKITLLINEENQGYVRCINQGIRRSNRDVLLLNSDTLVANNWLDRIIKRAYISTNIATVTPFSNNAEICSWPKICEVNPVYADATVQEIDRVFAELNPPPINLPTAVGFCMFVKRDCIDRIGLFDAATFGRGYGEENDFCMRAAALNYTHVLATDVYVHHHGGVSFGDEKKSLVQKAIAKLDIMYPTYAAVVARHIDDDPARKWRFAAELILLRRRSVPLVLHISHGIGGGTDKHVVELANFCSNNLQHAMLVPQANCMRLVFLNVLSGGLFEFAFHEMRELKNLLFSLSLSRIHIHHVKGWEDSIARVLKILDVPYDITLHDYYFLHTNPALADKRGYFCEAETRRDEICAEAIPLPKGMDGDDWRQQWASILNRAERVFAPSNAAASIYNTYHPELSITCAYHPDNEHIGSYPAVDIECIAENNKLRIVVLGALSLIKGANVLERVSQLSAKAGAPLQFTLVGYAYKKLAGSVESLGAYHDSDLPGILQRLKPHVVWFPCTWPETYSYTLSIALEAGLPVICPNLGAFPERLQNRPYSWIEPWNITPRQWLQRLLEIREEFLSPKPLESWQGQPRSAYSYSQQYRHSGITPDLEPVSGEQLMAYWLRELPEASTANRRFYRVLIWLNSHKLFGHIANLIPLWVRRTVKRKLSTRPLHE